MSEPTPATIAELKAEFPDDPQHALDCAEQALTLTEAKAAYADVLKQRITSGATAGKSRLPGVPATASRPAEGSGEGADGGDPIEQFNSVVEKEMAKGIARKTAISRVAAKYPHIHEAYLMETNRGNPAALAAIKERFSRVRR